MGVAGLPDVSSVDVGLHYVSSSGRPTTTTIIVSVHCQPKPTDYERTATEIAATVMKNDDHAKEVDFITVNFLEGFKVGLASFNFTHPFRHSSEEWAICSRRAAFRAGSAKFSQSFRYRLALNS
jgi:hypothetical protein